MKKKRPTISDVVDVILKIKAVDENIGNDLYYLILTYNNFNRQDDYDKEITKELKEVLTRKVINATDVQVIWDYLKLPDKPSKGGYIASRFK